MVEAGLQRARELVGEDAAYRVSAIFLAMEYERLGALGQLTSLSNQPLKISQK